MAKSTKPIEQANGNPEVDMSSNSESPNPSLSEGQDNCRKHVDYNDDLHNSHSGEPHGEPSDIHNDMQAKDPSRHNTTRSPRSPQELVAEGVSFFSGLTKTLESPEATRELVDSIVDVDKDTGETTLKIPVPDKESVAQMFGALSKLFTQLGGSK